MFKYLTFEIILLYLKYFIIILPQMKQLPNKLVNKYRWNVAWSSLDDVINTVNQLIDYLTPSEEQPKKELIPLDEKMWSEICGNTSIWPKDLWLLQSILSKYGVKQKIKDIKYMTISDEKEEDVNIWYSHRMYIEALDKWKELQKIKDTSVIDVEELKTLWNWCEVDNIVYNIETRVHKDTLMKPQSSRFDNNTRNSLKEYLSSLPIQKKRTKRWVDDYVENVEDWLTPEWKKIAKDAILSCMIFNNLLSD